MKKILLVGDGNHQLLTTYSNWLIKTNSNIELDILSFKEVDKVNSYTQIYPVKVPNFFNKYPKIRSFIFYIKIHQIYKKIFKSYDIIHFHMASPSIRYLISKECKAKKILTFWGSDFYKAGDIRKKIIKNIIDNADELTCTNPQMAIDICNTYNIVRNFKVITYILQPLEDLKTISLSNDKMKKNLSITTNRIILTIGTNNNLNQNHLEIINQLVKVKNLSKIVFIIIPLSYGRAGVKNVDSINEVLTRANFNFKIITDYMNYEEVTYLRSITDIFIQLQSTDQLSAAMIEHMYANNIVITGSWLPYSIFIENAIYFHTIDKIIDLPEIIEYCIRNIDSEKLKTQNNSNTINEIFGAETAISKWNALYN